MNLLVINDERNILDMVMGKLEAVSPEIGYIGAASSAAEARRLMEARHFDIFLCDIVMPGEDGISFAKWVLEKHPDVKFIFLTAHADFEYMKEAISMQSFDYLLQPAREEELKKVLERAIVQVKIERKNRETLERGTFFADYEKDLLEKGALDYLRGASRDSACLTRILDGEQYKDKHGTVYFATLFHVLKSSRPAGGIEKELLREIYRNICCEIFEPVGMSIGVLLEEEDDFLCLLHGHREALTNGRGILEQQMELLRGLFLKLLGSSLAVYCAEVGGLEELPDRFSALEQGRRNNVRRESAVFWVSEGNQLQTDGFSFEAQMPAWKKLIEQGRLEEFEQSLFQYMDRFTRKSEVNMKYLIKLHQSVSELLLSYQVNHSIDSRKVFDRDMPYLEFMGSWKSVESFQYAISYVIRQLLSAVGAQTVDVTEEAIRYVQENLDRDLSVGEVADHIGLNPEYFTRLFKKNTGHNLKEFIVNEKINAAKMLLGTTHMSVTMIAGHVGYANYSNFTRSFKQLVGCTPLEYRQRQSDME